MKTSTGTTVVSNVSYNAANQLLTINYPTGNETHSYNTLNQLTNLNVQNPIFPYGTAENLTYNYPTGTNNGKIGSTYNAVSGETVTYTYDSLNRLLTANGSGWGQQYGFDGFGNLLSKAVTAGSGPSLSISVNTANNQIQGVSGLSYDANGNQNVGNYDAENRLTATGTMQYDYDAQNKRIWSWPGTLDSLGNTTNYTVNVYSPSGQKLGAYLLAPATVTSIQGQTTPFMQVTLSSGDTYFGARRLAAMDELGSNVWNSPSSSGSFFPWGEAKGGYNPQDTWNFATYWQDSASGLDYANNRYYANAYGRFMTPDPYQGSVGPEDPGSWNRYAYTRGDPANRNDPSGLCDSGDPSCVSQCAPADPICVAANGCDPADASCTLGSAGSSAGGSPSVPGSITYPVNGGPGDIGSLTVSLTGGGFTFQFADAADGALILGVCAAQPEICVILAGSGLLVYIAVQNLSTFSQALENAASTAQTNSQPECDPPPLTRCYEPNSGHTHNGWDPHHHIWQQNQLPTGKCKWNRGHGTDGATEFPPTGMPDCSAYQSWPNN